jgi:hypothetical protein
MSGGRHGWACLLPMMVTVSVEMSPGGTSDMGQTRTLRPVKSMSGIAPISGHRQAVLAYSESAHTRRSRTV